MKLVLGMEVGLSPGDFVLDGDPVPFPQKGRSPLPNFRPISVVAKGLDASRCHLVWMMASAQGLCVRWRPSLPSPTKGAEPPSRPSQFSAHFYCAQTAGCIKMPLGMEVGLSLGEFVLDPAPSPKRGRISLPNFKV